MDRHDPHAHHGRLTNMLTQLLRSSRFKPWWRALFVALLLVISCLAFSPQPPEGADTGWDKANHLLAFCTLAAVSALSLQGARRQLTVALGLLAYGVLIELVQTQVPGRSAEAADVLADMVGVALGLLLLAGLERLASSSDGPARSE